MPQRQHPSYASGPLPASPFQACFDQASVGLALTALDGTWVWVNQRWCDLLGTPRDALQDRPCHEWMDSANHEADLALFAPRCTDGHPPSIRTARYLRPDGSLVRFHVASSLVHDGSGAPRYALRVLEPLPPPQLPPDDHAPKPAHEPTLPVPPPAQTHPSTPGGAPLAENGRHADGQRVLQEHLRTEEHLGQRVHDTLQGLLSLAETLVPVSEAQTTSAESAQLSAVLAQRLAEVTRSVLDCQRVDIAQVEAETGTLRPLALVGFAPQEAEQWWADWSRQPFENLHLAEPALLPQASTDAVLVQEATAPSFRERPNPFGIRRWLFAPLRLDRRLAGAIGIDNGGAEHTYQPEEVTLVKSLAHLGALLLERERLLEEREEARAHVLALREANQRLDTFLGLAGHELKTPLAVLTLQVQVAQRRLQQALAQGGGEPSEHTERLQAAATQLNDTGTQLARIERLVGELLDTSRIQAGRLELHLQGIDLLALVQEVVEEQLQLVPTRQLALQVVTAGEVQVLADTDRLRQVLINYLTNALKYSPETAPVLVGVEREATEVRVWVRDQGPGLSLEQQERIWERFYRVPGIEVQSGSGVGLGLGLYLCKTLIDRHGGQVGVQSTPGAGSTFWFTLPLALEASGR